uniref:Uncharacterized protein n=1 Tax=Anguilla anguilla TaxID=7936 RepID=A0A0E9XB10_ANGAN
MKRVEHCVADFSVFSLLNISQIKKN